MNDITIREGSIQDFDAILALQLQLEDAEIEFDSNLKPRCYSTEKGMEMLKKRLQDENNILLVATNNDEQIIGFADGSIRDNAWWYVEPVAFLNHLAVDKKYRNQGVGTLLLHNFEDKIKEKGASYIRLLAFPENIPAVNLYKDNNYNEYSIYYQKKIK